VSYLARLREQSGLTVLGAEAPRREAPRDAPLVAPRAEAGDLHVAEVLDVPAPVSALPARPTDGQAAERPRVVEALPAPETVVIETRRADDRVADAVRPAHDGTWEPPAAVRDRMVPSREPAAPPVEVVRPRATNASDLPLLRETTLRHVFEWLSAPPAPVDEHDAAPPHSPEALASPPAERAPVAAVRSVAPPAPTPEATHAVRTPPRPGPPSRPQSHEVEIADGERERPAARSPRGAHALDAGVPVRDAVEETITVSIGAINVRVDAPAPAVTPRPAAAKPARAGRRPPSRLARHYLRP
jgi:hypothetical protein